MSALELPTAAIGLVFTDVTEQAVRTIAAELAETR